MTQETTLEMQQKRRRKTTEQFLQDLESAGGFLLDLAKFLEFIGWAIIKIVQFIRNMIDRNESEKYI
ncbi:MAG: hypothetical protein ACYDAJ_07250 [Nitrosotalea sp.]